MIDFIFGVGLIGFLVFLILVFKSFIKRDGLLKRNGILLGSSFVILIIGAANLDSPSEPVSEEEKNAPVESNVEDEDNDIALAKAEAEAEAKAEAKKLEEEEKERAALKRKEETEKADREKKEAEAKQVAKEKEAEELAGELGELKVHYINVGQADATLLEVTENGEKITIVIDAGDWNKTDALDYLKAMNVTHIDVLVGTHPHADHIGQMDKILHAINVDEVWMSGSSATSQVFHRVLEAIDSTGANYVEPQSGENYQIGHLNIDILSPSSISGNANDDSIAMRIAYGSVAFVFTGDAETKAEQAMVNSGQNLKADILHIGHHGSDTSTAPTFLSSVDPKVAIYSAGNNGYGHPSPSVVNRVQDANIDLYGTDVHGTIIVTTDGKTYSVAPNQNGTITASTETPKQESKPKAESKAESKPASESKEKPKETVAPNGCIDINAASKEELQGIKHIGPERADLVIQKRPFSSVEDLTNIKGIAAGRLADILEEGKACVR